MDIFKTPLRAAIGGVIVALALMAILIFIFGSNQAEASSGKYGIPPANMDGDLFISDNQKSLYRSGGGNIKRIYDRRFGVVCYIVAADAISCQKV